MVGEEGNSLHPPPLFTAGNDDIYMRQDLTWRSRVPGRRLGSHRWIAPRRRTFLWWSPPPRASLHRSRSTLYKICVRASDCEKSVTVLNLKGPAPCARPGGYKEMSSILADQRPRICAQMRGKGGVAGSQPTSTAVNRSLNKLWKSNSIFNAETLKMCKSIGPHHWRLKGAQAWPSRGWVFLHKADTYGYVT